MKNIIKAVMALTLVAGVASVHAYTPIASCNKTCPSGQHCSVNPGTQAQYCTR